MNAAKIASHFRVAAGAGFRLTDHRPDEALGLDKEAGEAMLGDLLKQLHQLQETFYADGRWAMLIVLQAMDAAGKDGIIEHVIGAMNPQGCEVHPFKVPNEEERSYDFLWRAGRRLPARGRIAVFNRSYYEDVLVVRVHPELLAKDRPRPAGNDIWTERYQSIRGFERHLAANGTCVLKFFLNISHDEQRERFLDRIDKPEKNWKFSMGDVRERALWPKYMDAYESAIRATAAKDAAWFVAPADRKWFGRLVVAAALVDAIERLKPQFPKVDGESLKGLQEARKALKAGA